MNVPALVTPGDLHALAAGIRDPGGPVAVLTGTGPDFCVGRAPGADRAETVHALRDYYAAVAGSPVPVLTAVRGTVRGIGWALAAASDLTLAGPGARFSLPEVADGYPPLIALSAVLARGLRQPLLHAAVTGTVLDAAAALRIGAVAAVVDDLPAATARTAAALGTAAAAHVVRSARTTPDHDAAAAALLAVLRED